MEAQAIEHTEEDVSPTIQVAEANQILQEYNLRRSQRHQELKPHMVYAGTLLVICLMCLGFFIWKENKAAEIAKLQIQQKMQIETEKKKAAEKSRKQQDECLANADASYSLNWAEACQANAASVKAGYVNCMQGFYSTESMCRNVWGTPDAGADCTLPGKKADSINQYHKEAKDDCFKRYPIKDLN